VSHRAQTEVEAQFIKALRPYILPHFWCDHVEQHELQQARKSNDYTKVVEFYRGQMEAATSLLTPKQGYGANAKSEVSAIPTSRKRTPHPAHATGSVSTAWHWHRERSSSNFGRPNLDNCYVAAGPHVMIQCWERLISDIGYVAAYVQLSLKGLENARDDRSRTTRRRLACQLVLAMRLMLRARLYYERSDSILTAENLTVEAIRGERATFPRSQLILNKLNSAVAQYDRQLHKWHVGPWLPVGWKDSGDAYAFDEWSQRFSQAMPGEEGWSRFPRLLSRELRYLRSRSALRQRFHELPLCFLRLARGRLFSRIVLFMPRLIWSLLEFLALWTIVVLLWIFMVAAGFGLKPRRVAGSVTLVIALFSCAYFADDTLASGCARFSYAHFAESLYNAIVNLTTLGGAPSPCGHLTGAIIAIESLAGYFLLSILAAMFFVWLTDR
jgi:hypothetical protein